MLPQSQYMTRDYDHVPTAQVAFNENLKLYTPPQDTPATLFQIIGSDYSQVVEINLAPGMTASFEPGTMMHMSDHIEPVANVGDLGQACTRMCCLSENFFRLNLTNTSDANQSLALTPAFPAKVVPVDLQVYPGGLFIKDHVFLGALGVDWTVHVRMVRSLGAGCFGGQGFFLNLLQGSSWAFLAAGGTVLEKHLAPDEVLLCDPSAVVAFEPSVGYSIQRVQGCVTCCFGGMGLFNTRLQGPGLVLLQSMPFDKLKKSVGGNQNRPNQNDNRQQDGQQN